MITWQAHWRCARVQCYPPLLSQIKPLPRPCLLCGRLMWAIVLLSWKLALQVRVAALVAAGAAGTACRP